MKKLKNLSLIIIYGAPGAGKTTLADLLRAELSYTAHIGVDHIKRFISEFREIPSHQEVSMKVINAMAEEYLRNGINVIVEQGINRSQVETLEKIAQRNNAKFFVYRLEASTDVRKERVAERTTKLGKPEIPKEVIDSLTKIFNENDYPSTQVFDSGKINAREKADLILKDLL
jgi:predicted kinase